MILAKQGEYVLLNKSPNYHMNNDPVYSKEALKKNWFRVETDSDEKTTGITFNNLYNWKISTSYIKAVLSQSLAISEGVTY